MSFFDEDEEPRRSTRPRPRRPGGGGGAAGADSQTLLVRRAVAGAFVVVVLLLLAIAINSCRGSQRRNSLKDYTRQVNSLGTASAQTGSSFFKLFNQGGGQSPQDLQTAISQLRVQAEQQLQQAQGLSVPDAMAGAQQSLLIALEFRRDGLGAIAQRIRTALGDQGDAADQAITQISGQMEEFLSSDVLYQARVQPLVAHALAADEIGGQPVGRSRFLPGVQWLSPQVVAGKLNQQLAGGSGRASNQPTGPGLHGTGLVSTTFGSTTLSPSTSNRLTYQASQPFTVRFQNQGDNDEFNVKVTVRITGSSGAPLTLTKTVDKIAKGETAEASLALDRTPPIGSAVTISVVVAAVPGEKKTDNNKASYQALFSRG